MARRVIAGILLLASASTNVFADDCCRQQMVTGSLSLDGVYTLLEERPFNDLAPQDQDICQSGCVYTRSGSPSQEEYCFAESPSVAASCSAFGEAESLLLEKRQLVEEIDTMNRSYVLGVHEVATRREVLNQVEAAKEMVTELLQDSSRAVRSAGSVVRQMDGEVVCRNTVTLVTSLVIALTSSNREETQVLAAQLISSAPSQPCSSAEREELSTNLEDLEAEQEEEEAAILQLESQLDELVVTIWQLEEQVATLTSQLVDQLGVQQVDDSGEVPLILRDHERLPVMVEEEQELPFALPLHVIPTAHFFI